MSSLQAQVQQLQGHVTQANLVPPASAVSAAKEPKMPLPEKYSGNRMTFRGFINQRKLIFQLQPQQNSTDSRRAGLILTLLSGEALNWASPLIKQQSPLLSDFIGGGNIFWPPFEIWIEAEERQIIQKN
uniref:DUF4939 domain-containing protein n=1 Tax=Xenopus tropicalis TaxID=8364 RepID=A0A6I8SBN0_XENTR